MKDCQGIRRIASKSWEIHKLQENVPDCPRIGILSQSVRECNPPKTVAMPAQPFSILGIVAKLHIPGDPVAIPFQTTREANGVQSTQNWPSFATHPRLRHNRPKPTPIKLDCRFTKDCNVIDMIALRLRQLHVTQGDQDQRSIEDRAQDHNVQATRGNSRSRDTTRFMSQSRNPHAIHRNGRTGLPESIEQAGALGGLVLPLRGDCETFWHKIRQPRAPR